MTSAQVMAADTDTDGFKRYIRGTINRNYPSKEDRSHRTLLLVIQPKRGFLGFMKEKLSTQEVTGTIQNYPARSRTWLSKSEPSGPFLAQQTLPGTALRDSTTTKCLSGSILAFSENKTHSLVMYFTVLIQN